MIHRAHALSSTNEAFNQECDRLRSTFTRLGYPIHLINTTINNFVQSLTSGKRREKAAEESNVVRISLPFKDQTSANAVRRQMCDLSHKIGTNLQHVFVSKKLEEDLKPKEKKPPMWATQPSGGLRAGPPGPGPPTFSGSSEFSQNLRRQQRNIRLDPLDYCRSEDTEMGPRDSFRVNAFIAVLDVLACELEKRTNAYAEMNSRFGFLRRLPNMTTNSFWIGKFGKDIRGRPRRMPMRRNRPVHRIHERTDWSARSGQL